MLQIVFVAYVLYITPRCEYSATTVSTVISYIPLAPDEILSQSSGDYLSQIEQHALPSEAHPSSITIQAFRRGSELTRLEL